MEKYLKIAFSKKDQGTRFERLMCAYLMTDPKYVCLFQSVCLFDDFFSKSDLGSQDTGIDLIAKTKDGAYWAIQCKCYKEDAFIQKADVDSFFAT